MNNEPIVIERTIHAPAEKIWKALTDMDKMKQWYFHMSDFRPEIDFEFSFVGGDNEGIEWVHLCKVTEVIPNRKLTHSWRYKGYEGESFVTWELLPEGENTKVRLTHAGLETFPAEEKAFAKENFEAGWTEIVGTGLKNFVEQPETV